MRWLMLLLLAAAAAYFTAPAREAHEQAARIFLEARDPSAGEEGGLTLESMVSYAKGVWAGTGRFENYHVATRYTVDMPGAEYLECYGAFTIVRCSVAGSNPGG
jgi:hypothetical protein